jgi:hypothetical protein
MEKHGTYLGCVQHLLVELDYFVIESANLTKVGTNHRILQCREVQVKIVKNRDCPAIIRTVGNYGNAISITNLPFAEELQRKVTKKRRNEEGKIRKTAVDTPDLHEKSLSLSKFITTVFMDLAFRNTLCLFSHVLLLFFVSV